MSHSLSFHKWGTMIKINYFPKLVCAVVLSLSVLVSGCSDLTTSTPDTGTTGAVQQVADAQPLPGGQFNRYFPRGADGYSVTFRQEKEGFAQAQLSRGGDALALLSINDLANNPSAARKFQESTQRIGGYPAVTQGRNTTALLVGDRFQVKVQSSSESFTPSDREVWLQNFNLSGLAQLR
ncbi:MAG: hypothetical protein P5685_18960 [Limnospira sp. PMC 1261.20]|nr:hypothetical protein [Limnospira sp. PMC 1261.20]